jgi:hypothetical protein
VGATCLAALTPWREERGTWLLRGVVFAATFSLAMLPALSQPGPDEPGDLGEHSRHSFASGWQPAGRDRITALREDAERYGPRRPCLWVRVAQLETMIGMRAEAARDEAKAGAGSQCQEIADRFERVVAPPLPTDRPQQWRPIVRH